MGRLSGEVGRSPSSLGNGGGGRLAPTTGCDAGRVGATAAVHDTADYYVDRAG